MADKRDWWKKKTALGGLGVAIYFIAKAMGYEVPGLLELSLTWTGLSLTDRLGKK